MGMQVTHGARGFGKQYKRVMHSKPQTEQWAASLVFLKGWWNYLISEGKALEVTGALSSLQGVSVIAVT